jgi:hypothetical protein
MTVTLHIKEEFEKVCEVCQVYQDHLFPVTLEHTILRERLRLLLCELCIHDWFAHGPAEISDPSAVLDDIGNCEMRGCQLGDD